MSRRAASSGAANPKAIKLKDPKDWRIGRSRCKRLSTADKLNGSKNLRDRPQAAGHAVRRDQGLPGVRRKVTSFDESNDRRAQCPAWKKV